MSLKPHVVRFALYLMGEKNTTLQQCNWFCTVISWQHRFKVNTYVTCESRVVIKQQTCDSFQGLRDTDTSVYMSEARCVSSGGFMAVCVCVFVKEEGGHGGRTWSVWRRREEEVWTQGTSIQSCGCMKYPESLMFSENDWDERIQSHTQRCVQFLINQGDRFMNTPHCWHQVSKLFPSHQYTPSHFPLAY